MRVAGKRVVKYLIVLIVSIACAAFPLAGSAWAEGGVQLAEGGVHPDLSDAVSAKPHISYFVSLQFTKNVGFARVGQDGSFVEENCGLVHVYREDGSEFPVQVFGGGSFEERQLLYVRNEQWFDPLARYTIVVEPGIRAANGEDATIERYEISFRTDGATQFGFGVFINSIIAFAMVAIVFGIVFQALKYKKIEI